MAPVFFEMSDLYDEGKIKSVPDAMNFLVNGIFAIAGRPIYHHVYIRGEMYEIIPKSCGFTWLYEAALPYVEAVFYRTAPLEELNPTTPKPSKFQPNKVISIMGFYTLMSTPLVVPEFHRPY